VGKAIGREKYSGKGPPGGEKWNISPPKKVNFFGGRGEMKKKGRGNSVKATSGKQEMSKKTKPQTKGPRARKKQNEKKKKGESHGGRSKSKKKGVADSPKKVS